MIYVKLESEHGEATISIVEHIDGRRRKVVQCNGLDEAVRLCKELQNVIDAVQAFTQGSEKA